MDTQTLINIALVVLFVLVGGVFSGTEFALVSMRESQIRQLENSGGRGRTTARLARNPNTFLSAVQIGVTVTGFFSAAYGASVLAPDVAPLLERAGLPAGAAESVSFIVLTLAVAYLSLVFGELVPKRLALQNAAGIARIVGPALARFAWLVRPVIWLLSVSTNGVVRLLGGDPDATTAEMNAEELAVVVSEVPGLPKGSRTILSDVLDAGERTLREVMRPRPDVSFLDAGTRITQARSDVHALPFSRYPVTGESVDDIVGFVHVRDLFERTDGALVADLVRPILTVPQTNRVLATLTMMRRQRDQIAVVVDEFGGTAGIVTLEDLVEEVVGEIYDEYDSTIEPEDAVVDRGDGTYRVQGGLILQEFARATGIELPDGDYETVAGFVIAQLGRIPVPGDEVAIPGYRLEVLNVSRHRVDHVRVVPADPVGGRRSRAGDRG